MEASQKETNLTKFVNAVQQAFGVIDLYEGSRVSALTFTKLEEAILWAQVMVGQTKLKSDETETKVIPDEKVEVITD